MIAAQHYLQIRDAHFDLAAGIESADTQRVTKSVTLKGDLSQKASQHQAARDRMESRKELESPCLQAESREVAMSCESARNAAKQSNRRRRIRTFEG